MKNKLLWVLLAMVTAAPAWSGTQAVMEDIGSPQNNRSIISAQDHWLRIDNSSKEETSIIFNLDQQEMLILNPAEKSFMRMNKATLQQLTAQLVAAKKQMEAQLANMPPQQREMVKKMMANNGAMFDPPQKPMTEWKSTSRKGMAADQACVYQEYWVDGLKTTEFCVAPKGQVTGAEQLLTSMKAMASMFDEFVQSMAQSFPMLNQEGGFSGMQQLDGFPVIITHFKQDGSKDQRELKSVESQSFASDFFMPPIGYKEKTMPKMP